MGMAGALILVLGTGINAFAFNTVTGDSGIVHVCIPSSGHQRLDGGWTICRPGEKTIFWAIKSKPGKRGPAGPQGLTGDQGPIGPKGAVGAQGPIGPRGLVGARGLIGLPGADGLPGSDGLPGADGVDGSDGLPGADGLPGSDGVDGVNGLPGADGAPGVDGLPGTDGAVGPSGPPGADGLPGADGAVGPSGPPGPTGAPGPSGAPGADGVGTALYYGSFYDTTTQTTTADTETAMTLNTTDVSNGVSIVGGSQITFAHAGIYNVQFSAQVDKTGSNSDSIDIWLRQNGTNVPWSNTSLTIAGSARSVAAWNFVVSVADGGNVELMWSSPTANMEIISSPTATGPTRPAVPSVIVTATRVG